MVELSSANQQVVLMGLRGKQKHTFILISFEIIFPQLPYEVTVEDLNLNNSKWTFFDYKDNIVCVYIHVLCAVGAWYNH